MDNCKFLQLKIPIWEFFFFGGGGDPGSYKASLVKKAG